MARSYPTLVGLGGGHCLAAFCLALLMDILYRKVWLLSTVTFICWTNKIPAASSQPARDSASSYQLAGTVIAQEGHASESCAHRALGAHLADLAPLVAYIIP